MVGRVSTIAAKFLCFAGATQYKRDVLFMLNYWRPGKIFWVQRYPNGADSKNRMAESAPNFFGGKMARFLDSHEVLSELAKATGKPCLHISFDWGHAYYAYDGSVVEILRAAPYLNTEDHGQILSDGQAWIVCDSEEERENLFWQTVGDDGPTKLNSYNGPAKVYALTANPDGSFGNENT